MTAVARGVLLAALALVAGRRDAQPQEPAARARLDSIRAWFTGIGDSTVLLARERERMASARANRDDPMAHLELGFLAFRLGELTASSRHYDAAAGEFEWAAELRPDWPYPWYWLGVTELAIGESRVIPLENIRQLLGVDALSKAATAFARAAQADPSFSAALVDLATTALRQRISPRLVVARQALRMAGGTAAVRLPSVLLQRGRIERELNQHDSALAAFRAYLEAGGDTGVGRVEMARSHAALGGHDSAVAAYQGALRAPATGAAREELRREVRWIASVEELRELDALPADSVGSWLRRFWGRREVADGRRPGERLVEQFRRYRHARANFTLLTRHRRYDIADAYRDTTQREFDDRGVIYLRHGEPDRRARYADEHVEPNESWAYRRAPPERDLVFHFVARDDVQDYKLVESLLDAYGFGAAVWFETRADAPTAPVAGLLASRAELSPIYQRLARGGTAGRAAWLAGERAEGRRAIRVGTSTDSHEMRFGSDLRPVVTHFAVADAARRPELHVVFAVPGDRLRRFAAPRGYAFPLSLRLLVFDPAMRPVAALDTVRVFGSAQPLAAGSYLTERVALRVPPGRYRFHFVVEEIESEAGAMVSSREVEIPDPASGFSASDLVVGREGSGLVWRRPEGEIPLNPLQRFPRDGRAELYYEVYGLEQGASVATRLGVVPVGRRSIFRRLLGGSRGTALAYVTVTDAPQRARVRQQLDLGGLAPGRYALELELRDPVSGVRLTRRQQFEISGERMP